MKYILLTSILFLTACGGMKPVEGAPEILVRNDSIATVVTQIDGKRLVTLNRGEVVYAIILLPAAKVEVNVEKEK